MTSPEGRIHILTRINERVERVLLGFALLLMITFVVVVITEVFFRYVLESSQVWTQETARLTFMWSIFVGAAVAFRHGDHLIVDAVRFHSGSKAARIHEWALHVLALLVLVAYTYFGVQILPVGMARSFLVLPFSIGVGWLAIPFMTALAVLFIVERIVIGLRTAGDSFDPPRVTVPFFAGEEDA